MIDIRQPNITAKTETEQLLQMRSYLYQLSQQLQFAFSTISQESGAASSASVSVQGNQQESDPESSFAALKSLIIKSADIVNAYYTEINGRLEKIYLAKSDFGVYREQADMEIQKNADGVSQLFSGFREISETVEELHNQMLTTNAYIRTGLLYENESGHPVYGMEIGQTNTIDGQTVFDKFARFSSDRLSFFDSNDTEVAYISEYKLYITNAEVTGGLVIAGRFKIYYNGGLSFQWIGDEA